MLFTYNECVNKYGSKYLVSKAVKAGQLYKQESGVYSDKEYVPALAVIARKYPDAIFTMNSAFYYYDLTDVIPEKFYLATDRDATKIADKRVVQIFERRNLLDATTSTGRGSTTSRASGPSCRQSTTSRNTATGRRARRALSRTEAAARSNPSRQSRAA